MRRLFNGIAQRGRASPKSPAAAKVTAGATLRSFSLKNQRTEAKEGLVFGRDGIILCDGWNMLWVRIFAPTKE
jgi:hypothetical protein